MIKATELQIRDYVLVSGTPRRVESITKKKIGYHINPHTDKRLYFARLRDVEPIKVTNSLFEKVFEQGKDPNHFEFDDGIFCITFSLQTEGSCYIKVVEDFITNAVLLENVFRDNLHLVQNALRVFDIEIDWRL